MRRVKWYLLSFLLVTSLGVLGSCSEDTITSEEDVLSPTTEVIFPISTADARIDVSDSIHVFVTAKDNIGIARLEIWTASERSEEPDLLVEMVEPTPISQIPDSLRPNDDSNVYRAEWRTRLIRNGTIVRIFSRAFDSAGNSTRSELVSVRILNEGGDLNPPNADFAISPGSGTVETIFSFDASLTSDEIDPAEDIIVRWDFDGDGTWDHDFDEELPATQIMEHKYALPRIYTVTLEAKNSYLPGQTGTFQRALEVTNVGGDPNPPEEDEMLLVPAGLYRVGAADTSVVGADEDEFPLHGALMTADFFIRRTEVPNRLYLQFLNAELGQPESRVVIRGNQVWFRSSDEENVEQRILDTTISAIFIDRDTLGIAAGDRDLPVVGVSWLGAKSYAEFYGLRLPTEHEWEIAAKADSVNYLYPWGTTITPDQGNYNDPGNPFRGVVPIGSYPGEESPFGLLDLCGNVKEWVSDWYGLYLSGQQSNPGGPINPTEYGGVRRVLRGGSYLNTATGVRVTAREAASPETFSEQIGFRTAYTAPQ